MPAILFHWLYYIFSVTWMFEKLTLNWIPHAVWLGCLWLRSTEGQKRCKRSVDCCSFFLLVSWLPSSLCWIWKVLTMIFRWADRFILMRTQMLNPREGLVLDRGLLGLCTLESAWDLGPCAGTVLSLNVLIQLESQRAFHFASVFIHRHRAPIQNCRKTTFFSISI